MTEEYEFNVAWPNPQIVTSEPFKIVGVGGFGNKIVHELIGFLGKHVGDVYVDANLEALDRYTDRPTVKLQIADGEITRPDDARAAAEAAHQQLRQALGGARMVFIVSALGGVTGSGATAVVARIANQIGILTMCMFTYPHEKNPPFPAHNTSNVANAKYGLSALRQAEGAIIEIREPRRTAFWGSESEETQLDCMDDDIDLWADRYSQSVRRIREDIRNRLCSFIAMVVEMEVVGLQSADFEDLRYVIERPGIAALGVGIFGGKNPIKSALKYAARALHADFSIEDASAVFLVITGSKHQISIAKQKFALNLLRKMLRPEAHISYGFVCDASLGECLSICLLATGAPISYHYP